MSAKRLYNAAARGDVITLQQLLEQDPLLLDRVSHTCSNKTPLHLATIHGHLPFVQAILNHNQDLALELDSHQSSALHAASSRGDLEIATELLSAAQGMCFSRDCQGRNPLHFAAMNGHVAVLEELVYLYPMAAQMKLDQGMTVLHLCVECEEEMVNAKNDNSETVLHMAVRDRQKEMVSFLLSVTSLEVNGLNLKGMTALDVLVQSKRNARDSEIEESLKRSLEEKGGVAHKQNNFKHHHEWLDRKRGALMVAASLIAAMAFQVGVNPPGGVWQDDDPNHPAGYSILARNYPFVYTKFYAINTIGFLASLSIILLLMSGLPLRRKFFVWVLMVITWIAISAITVVYMFSLWLLAPVESPTWSMTLPGVFIGICLMGLLVIGNTIRLIVKLDKNMKEKWRKRNCTMVIRT